MEFLKGDWAMEKRRGGRERDRESSIDGDLVPPGEVFIRLGGASEDGVFGAHGMLPIGGQMSEAGEDRFVERIGGGGHDELVLRRGRARGRGHQAARLSFLRPRQVVHMFARPTRPHPMQPLPAPSN